MANEEILRAVATLDDKMSAQLAVITAEFKKFERAAGGTTQNLNRDMSRLNATVVPLGRELRNVLTPALSSMGFVGGGIIGTFIGLSKVMNDVNKSSIELAANARLIGTNGPTLYALGKAFESVELPADDAAKALRRLRDAGQNIQSNLPEGKDFLDQFRYLPQFIEQFEGAAKRGASATELLRIAIEQGIKLPDVQKERFAKTLGLSEEDARIFTKDFLDTVEEELKKARNFPDPAQAKAYRDAIRGINESFNDLTRTLTIEMGPAFTTTFNSLNEFIKTTRKEIEAIIALWEKAKGLLPGGGAPFGPEGKDTFQPPPAYNPFEGMGGILRGLFGISPANAGELPEGQRSGAQRHASLQRLMARVKEHRDATEQAEDPVLQEQRRQIWRKYWELFNQAGNEVIQDRSALDQAGGGDGGGGVGGRRGFGSHFSIGGGGGPGGGGGGRGGGGVNASGMTRGDRNNNPGNIKTSRFGAVGRDEQGHAIFANPAAGQNALRQMLQENKWQGLTLDQFGNQYSEGNADWKRTVGAALGIGPNDVVNTSDPRLPAAIAKAEGTHWSRGRDLLGTQVRSHPGTASGDIGYLKQFIRKGSGANLDQIDPRLASRYAAAVRAMPESVRRTLSIESGYRGIEEQRELRRRFEMGIGGIAARPGESMHNFGDAIDANRSSALDWLHEHGHKYGLANLGHKDYPHIQLPRSERGRLGPYNNRPPVSAGDTPRRSDLPPSTFSEPRTRGVGHSRILIGGTAKPIDATTGVANRGGLGHPDTGPHGAGTLLDLDPNAQFPKTNFEHGKDLLRQQMTPGPQSGIGERMDRASAKKMQIGEGKLVIDGRRLPRAVEASVSGTGLFKKTQVERNVPPTAGPPPTDYGYA